MDALGICVGASTIGIVRLQQTESGPKVVWARTRSHEGDSRGTLREMLSEVEDLENLKIAATGRKFRHLLTLSNISEPEAVELAAEQVLSAKTDYKTIISAGGETFLVYALDNEGKVQDIHTGNKCASGTGEFLLQQLGRMGLSLDEVSDMDIGGPAHAVSGRCSVFCKSDCTHALNKGVPKLQVVAGLAKMMANKSLELLKKLPKDKVMLIGGCSKNRFMVHYLQQEIEDLFIPEEADWFEAFGAGLWALRNETEKFPGLESLFIDRDNSFAFLEPLAEYTQMVSFKSNPRGVAQKGDRVILGLDVGSTTTKGVLMRVNDQSILAGDYLRTDGDPVGASRQVYKSLDEQIAHAAAAVHFDPEVDTIFEIGGQDAKYTYITNSVPCDYAMNEACSAGTGSFLEESAKETLGIEVKSIGDIAVKGKNPPNFNDQCAAFISSDIKIATQEGLPLQDIVSGLVYSICMNYSNRVKGNRPVGQKVFMQGGVCYNHAVPVAMAALTGKEIIVPPEPGLMGAFGVALEIQNRLEQGLLEPSSFDLKQLAEREVVYKQPFICKGGKEKCDRRCDIARIEIEGKIFPFGGICNRYDNIINKREVDASSLNYVVKRERRVFRDLPAEDADDPRPTVGINRSFLLNTYFPLFQAFFEELGFRVVVPDEVDPEGVEQRGAAFCFPGELAHGYMANLLQKDPDYIFLPHIRSVPAQFEKEIAYTCVLVQGEAYYLKHTFPGITSKGDRVLTPVLNFNKGIQESREEFLDIASWLGKNRDQGMQAFKKALKAHEEFESDLKDMGRQALEKLNADPELTAVALFGRPYNAFASVANKGIPAKFATRGVLIIPFDMLGYEQEELDEEHNMYWGLGRMILQASKYVYKHPKLFAAYITNFSCGPDSFLVGYFRDIMGRKPSLTLELDSHTADAGLETRIEAFLDIINYYRNSGLDKVQALEKTQFRPAEFEFRDDRPGIRTSSNEWVPLTDERVRMVLPSMNYYSSRMVAQVLGRGGIRAVSLPPPSEEDLKLGRGNSTCKECLPLQLTVGSLLDYLQNRQPGEITVYMMPSAGGPCRFGQYNVFSKKVINKHQIPDAAVFAPTSLNAYGGLGDKLTIGAWQGIVVGELFLEMYSTILTAAKDKNKGLELLNQEFEKIMSVAVQGWKPLSQQLSLSARELAKIELERPYSQIPKISLIGEIYVRHDPLSRQGLIERLAERGFIVRVAKLSEWMKYTDWLIKHNKEGHKGLGFWISHVVKHYFDAAVRRKMAPCGLFYTDVPEVDEVIEHGEHFVSSWLSGEAILTIGSAFHEMMHPACGVISIGPFGCMPSRVAEAILSEKFTSGQYMQVSSNGDIMARQKLDKERKLPFLAIETDGNPFPQIIEARLEAFCLQAQRFHKSLLNEPKPILS